MITDNKESKSSMVKHMNIYHDKKDVGFTAKVLAKHKKVLNRFIDESLRIEEGEKKHGLADSKSEWGSGALVRLQVTNKRQRNQNQPQEAPQRPDEPIQIQRPQNRASQVSQCPGEPLEVPQRSDELIHRQRPQTRASQRPTELRGSQPDFLNYLGVRNGANRRPR